MSLSTAETVVELVKIYCEFGQDVANSDVITDSEVNHSILVSEVSAERVVKSEQLKINAKFIGIKELNLNDLEEASGKQLIRLVNENHVNNLKFALAKEPKKLTSLLTVNLDCRTRQFSIKTTSSYTLQH